MKIPFKFWMILAASLFFPIFLGYRVFFPQDPVRVGYIGTLSGKFAALGSAARNGALLAVEEINRSGGIAGRPLHLAIRDDGGDPQRSLQAARGLASADVRALVGPFLTSCATAVVPFLNSVPLLCIGPVIAGDNLAHRDDYFLKLYPSTREFGTSLARQASRSGLRRIAVLYDTNNRVYGETLIQAFSEQFLLKGGTLSTPLPYQSTPTTSFLSLAKDLLQTSPDGILLSVSALDGALLCQHLHHLAPSVILLSSSWSISKEFLENAGKAAEGLLFSIPLDEASSIPTYRTFQETYRRRFGQEPPYAAAFNYEALYLLSSALMKNPEADTPTLKRLLLSPGFFLGLQEMVSLDAMGDTRRTLVPHTVRNGQFVSVCSDPEVFP